MISPTSTHILPAAANLVGFALFVLSMAKSFDLPSLVIKMASLGTLLFALSCVFSFLSIRSKVGSPAEKQSENIADYLFFAGLFILCALSMSIAFDIFKE